LEIESIALSAIILAGGKSRRMGRDKATIEIDGIPLIRRIYDVVAGCGDRDIFPIEIYVVTPWIERYRKVLPIDCNFIAEESPHQGPLCGFAQGLSQISSDWVFLVACDLPNLSTLAIESWIDRLKDIPPQSIAYLAKHADFGWEPLCGFYRRSCLNSLWQYIDDGGRSFQGWLKMNLVTELMMIQSREYLDTDSANPVDRSILFNCNTPADLASVLNRSSD
jgi:molybdenum cofactor guanylyltransferase